MEALKPYATLPHVLCAEQPHRNISQFVAQQYGKRVILTGIKNECRDEVYSRQYTYGIPLSKLCDPCGMDLLDYAQNTVVVYDSHYLKPTLNGDYEVKDPYAAVLGFVELTW